MNEEYELFLDDDAVFEMYCICILELYFSALLCGNKLVRSSAPLCAL